MRAPLFARRVDLVAGRALLACLAAVALGLGAFRAQADIQDPNKAHGAGAREQRRELPAHGVPQAVTIDQGKSITITLQARGQIGKSVDFIIRSRPVHGTIEAEPHQVGRKSAAVTYVHRAEDGPGTDSFTYSVQAAGSAVSGPIPVKIEIRDTPPLVVATPAELDFGTVKVGDSSGAEFSLENRGGGEAVGRVELPRPWVTEGAAEYRIARGQRQTFRVIFAPAAGRSFSETVHFAADNGAGAHLLGTGLGPPGEPPDPAATAAAARLAAAEASSSGPGSSGGGSGARGGGAGGGALDPNAALAAATAPGTAPVPSQPARLTGSQSGADPLQGIVRPPDEPATPEEPAAANSTPVDPGFMTLYDTGVKNLELRGTTPHQHRARLEARHPAPQELPHRAALFEPGR